MSPSFAASEKEAFERDGYVLIPGLAPDSLVESMTEAVNRCIASPAPPVEYEAGTGYPGAPTMSRSPGGHTVRRFLRAYDRDEVFAEWARNPAIVSRMRELLGPEIVLTRAHHNCIMVKDTRYSSDTRWHQDIRYWSFQEPELVSVLLALSDSTTRNGSLRFLPGTHRRKLERDRFDGAIFLREDLPDNQELLANIEEVEMKPGDVVFFHCRVLHSAPRNRSESPRISVIYTYRPATNAPLPDTRSASLAEIKI